MNDESGYRHQMTGWAISNGEGAVQIKQRTRLRQVRQDGNQLCTYCPVSLSHTIHRVIIYWMLETTNQKDLMYSAVSTYQCIDVNVCIPWCAHGILNASNYQTFQTL